MDSAAKSPQQGDVRVTPGSPTQYPPMSFMPGYPPFQGPEGASPRMGTPQQGAQPTSKQMEQYARWYHAYYREWMNHYHSSTQQTAPQEPELRVDPSQNAADQSSDTPTTQPAPKYELILGQYTWILPLMLTMLIGLTSLGLMWHFMGPDWFTAYYYPILGYYVLCAIGQAHYFPGNKIPSPAGLIRQPMTVSVAIILFWAHEQWLVNTIPKEAVMTGHFTFIVFGFFLFAWDDTCFEGKLTGIGKVPGWGRQLIWYIITWVLWILILGLCCGAYLNAYNADAIQAILGNFQLVIIQHLTLGLNHRDVLPEVLHGKLGKLHWATRGTVLTLYCIVTGVGIAWILYLINWACFPAPATWHDHWHHVLYQGTFPLSPAVMFGLYSHHFTKVFPPVVHAGQTADDETDWKMAHPYKRYFARLSYIYFLATCCYLLFHLVLAPTGILGMQGKPFYKQQALIVNFTVSILPLTHHWFCARWGFVRQVKSKKSAPAAAEASMA
eukprot:gnl/Trimastix_PCT/1100.p1 GENE.gnl/Trimastix_PCT/1100~~gnl/Trimastix_PCT/1100.p1  ORF type:complete len:497 (-),score=84.67 gnl/Trimastix_PCT/1100:148-1638(-)